MNIPFAAPLFLAAGLWVGAGAHAAAPPAVEHDGFEAAVRQAIAPQAAENQVPTHDYMSIAVEFDNGRDITFLWSHSLPVGEIFACPLPAWKDRETHVVARSGSAQLGQWLDEEFNLHELYRRAIGGEPPARVVRVWLIGVSLFGQGEGRSQFGQILLQSRDRRLAVY